MAGINSAEDSEVTYLTGIGDDGRIAGTSFWTWNNDNPATYTQTSYEAKWGQPTAGTAGGVVTFGFDAASNWTATEQSAFVATLSLWAAVANISFQQVGDATSADIDISRATDPGKAEGGITRLYLGDIGSATLGSAVSASISIDTAVPGFGPVGASFSDFGGYPWEVLLHEEGHALGLGHAGPYDGDVTSSEQQYSAYDDRAWSIMSYIDPSDTSAKDASGELPSGLNWGISKADNGLYYGNEPTTMMPLDILAIQRIYGLPTSTPLSGGQVFGFNSNIVGPIEPFFDFTKNTTPVVTLWDEGGGNTLDLSGFSQASSINLNDGTATSADGLTDNILIAYGTKIDTAVGGAGNDTIVANADGDVLIGGGGADKLIGGAGADTFEYLSVASSTQANPDTIVDFQTGVDKIDLSALKLTSDTVVQSAGQYVLEAVTTSGALYIDSTQRITVSDVISNLTPGVTITGTSGYDHLVSGTGNDVIIGGGGGDSLTGGAGADTFKYVAATDSTAQAYDIITDFQHGIDSIDLTAVAPTYISLVHYQGATYLFPSTPGGNMEIAAIGDVEGTDLITGAPVNLYLMADDNGDTLIGGAGADSLHGGAGNDVLIGGGAADALFGGAGADTFKYVAAGDSTASGYDIIQDFQHGVDAIDLTAVAPTYISLVHYQGATYLFPSTPGGAMEIAAIGDVEGTDLTGPAVNLYLVADDNGDTLIGGAGPDSLHGGAGNDVLIGGGAADALFGGAGADTFKYLVASDSTVAAPDIIQDFQVGSDKIDLTAIHTGFANAAYGLAYSGSGSFIYVDQNGDGVNDMLVEVVGATVHATDILW